MATTTVSIETAEGVDPFNESHPYNFTDKAKRIRRFCQFMMGIIGSGRRGGGATVRYGTAAASAIVTCAAVANADTVTVNGKVVTAAQLHATGTVTCTASGIDVADTVTVNGVVLTARQHYAKGTITLSSADAADNVTINGVTFVGTSGAVVLGEATYSVDTGDNEAATSLAAQINGHATVSLVVTASASSAVVTLRAVTAGTAGNAITLATTDGTDLAVSGATLSGATAVAVYEFDISGTDTQTAASLAAAVNAHPSLSGVVTAKSATNVCTIRAYTAGTAGNAITLASSDAQLAVSAATLANGAAASGDQFDYVGTNNETATSLASAIANSSTAGLAGIATAAASSATVTVSARKKGLIGNAITIATSNGTRLAITGSVSRLAGGTETAVSY